MGLIGGMARTAVVAGTATAVSNRVSRRQAARWDQKEYEQQAQAQAYAPAPAPTYAPAPPAYAPAPQAYAPAPAPVYAPPPAPAPAEDPLTSEIERLADLRMKGLLTDEEFAAAKAKLLGI